MLKYALPIIVVFCIGLNIHAQERSVDLGYETLNDLLTEIPTVTSIEYADSNGDGREDTTIIATNFATPNDIIIVYDLDGDLVPSGSIADVQDYDSDTWIFDAGGDNRVELVMQFFRTDTGITLEMTSDITGEGNVSFVYNNNAVTVTEGEYAEVIISVEDDWFLDNGLVNFNWTALGDGLNIQYDLVSGWVSRLQVATFLDGNIDIFTRLWDNDQDGLPEYYFRRAENLQPRSDRGPRSWFAVNQTDILPLQPSSDVVFWPFLFTYDPATSSRVRNLRYFNTPPLVYMDWELGELYYPVLYGYPIEEGWHTNATTYLTIEGNDNLVFDEEIDYANFELMQAYYDIAGDNDNNPELHIRHRYYQAEDDSYHNLPTPINSMRYSWDFDDDNRFFEMTWNYKLGLLNRAELNNTVETEVIDYSGIPHSELPDWVLDQSWEVLTFIAAETSNYTSGEGMYEWDTVETYIEEPVRGVTIPTGSETLARFYGGEGSFDLWEMFTVANDELAELKVGQRGELVTRPVDEVMLYTSSVDRRLHLRGAEDGITLLDDDTTLFMDDLDEDAYFDHWYINEGNTTLEMLAWTPDWLVLDDGSQVYLKQIQTPIITAEIPPPRDTESYVELETLVNTLRTVEADDFTGMYDQFDGEAVVLGTSRLQQFRRIDGDGFQFRLILQENFTGATFTNNVSIPPLEAGEYIVRYDETLSIVPIDDPLIAVEPIAKVGSPALTTQSITLLRYNLRNLGNTDIDNVIFRLFANEDFVATRFTSVNSDEPTQIDIDWLPRTDGEIFLRAEISLFDGVESVVVSEFYELLEVENLPTFNNTNGLSALGLVNPIAIFLLILLIPLGSVPLFWLLIADTDPQE